MSCSLNIAPDDDSLYLSMLRAVVRLTVMILRPELGCRDTRTHKGETSHSIPNPVKQCLHTQFIYDLGRFNLYRIS